MNCFKAQVRLDAPKRWYILWQLDLQGRLRFENPVEIDILGFVASRSVRCYREGQHLSKGFQD